MCVCVHACVNVCKCVHTSVWDVSVHSVYHRVCMLCMCRAVCTEIHAEFMHIFLPIHIHSHEHTLISTPLHFPYLGNCIYNSLACDICNSML